jgi:hypothetical protein
MGGTMIKTPMSEIKKLIQKYENHVGFCDKMFKDTSKEKMSMSAACWLEERSSYEKVLIDLGKLLEYREPDTNLEEINPN